MKTTLNKYKNQPVMLDGEWFPSKREANRWAELKLHERAGYIVAGSIERQVKFPLYATSPKGESVLVGNWIADFVYQDKDGKTHVEDSKGYATPQYRWKKKHVEIQYGIRIEET